MKMYSKLEIGYQTPEGKMFEAKRGKVSVDIGYESHGMFVMKMKYDWGVYTFGSFVLDYCVDYDVPRDERVWLPKPYAQPLVKAMLKVFNADYVSSINDAEVYVLFSTDNDHRNDPKGLVNIKDTQNSLIFDDFFAGYPTTG